MVRVGTSLLCFESVTGCEVGAGQLGDPCSGVNAFKVVRVQGAVKLQIASSPARSC